MARIDLEGANKWSITKRASVIMEKFLEYSTTNDLNRSIHFLLLEGINASDCLEAISKYDKVIDMDGPLVGQELAYLLRGVRNYNRGYYDYAVSDCDNAIRLGLDDSDVFYLKGLSYLGLELHKEAATELISAISRTSKKAPKIEEMKLDRNSMLKLIYDAEGVLEYIRVFPTILPVDEDGSKNEEYEAKDRGFGPDITYTSTPEYKEPE